MDQETYIENTLKQFGLEDANNTNTPLTASVHLEKSEHMATTETKTYYQQIIRTLIYATISRPDITITATQSSQYNNNPVETHIKYISEAQKSPRSNMMETQMLD